MEKNLDAATDFITQDEGGWVLKKNGACGNFGIGMATLITWRHLNNKPTPIVDDLKNLTRDEAKQVYASSLYAGGIHFVDMPNGLDYAMLDAAVNEGVGGALKFFAQAAAISEDVPTQIKAISALRLAAKQTRPDWKDYRDVDGSLAKGHGEGWTKRIGELVPGRALAMYKEGIDK